MNAYRLVLDRQKQLTTLSTRELTRRKGGIGISLVTLATVHAPKGGITIAGKKFTGGEFIPPSHEQLATDEQKKQLEMRPDLFDSGEKTGDISSGGNEKKPEGTKMNAAVPESLIKKIFPKPGTTLGMIFAKTLTPEEKGYLDSAIDAGQGEFRPKGKGDPLKRPFYFMTEAWSDANNPHSKKEEIKPVGFDLDLTRGKRSVGRAYLARLLGPNSQYGFDRSFISPEQREGEGERQHRYSGLPSGVYESQGYGDNSGSRLYHLIDGVEHKLIPIEEARNLVGYTAPSRIGQISNEPPDDPMERMEWEQQRELGRTGELPGA